MALSVGLLLGILAAPGQSTVAFATECAPPGPPLGPPTYVSSGCMDPCAVPGCGDEMPPPIMLGSGQCGNQPVTAHIQLYVQCSGKTPGTPALVDEAWVCGATRYEPIMHYSFGVVTYYCGYCCGAGGGSNG